MKKILCVLAAAAALIIPSTVAANPYTCKDVTEVIGNASIAGGAVTASSVTEVRGYRELVFIVSLTDADNSVTNLDITFTDARTSSSTAKVVAGCAIAGAEWTCTPLTLKWDPSTSGKEYEIPAPSAYNYITPTITPTGHGAGDAVTLSIRACY